MPRAQLLRNKVSDGTAGKVIKTLEAVSTPAATTQRVKTQRVKTQRVKIQRRPLHGVLLLDKPLDLSSNDALQKAKWLLRAEKAGHTGTLDPLATGVLPICFGAATKFSHVHLDAHKHYVATLKLGVQTSTADREGDVIATHPVTPSHTTPAALAAACKAFTGQIAQTPPMTSALKKDGKPLYEFARQGIEIAREARHITIFSLALSALSPDELRLEVRCSKGTYIRTLGEDIGQFLGCSGHLSSLRRVGTGGFDASQCITLQALETLDESARQQRLLPIDSLLAEYPKITLPELEAAKFLTGLRRRVDAANAELIATYAPDGNLLGSARVVAGELIPIRLLSPLEVVQQLC